MNLPDYIDANKDRLIERWKQLAVERLALELEASELLNDLPTFIDDVVTTLRDPGARWRGDDLVEAAREIVLDHAEARNQRIDLDIESFEIEADRKLLVSALTNLLENAIKFTHDGGSIEVRASTRDSRALFEVQDECGGMPEDLPAKLFQPFTQAHADKSGFGLGLMIVKQAAEAHHGSVRVVNRPGECCTFVLDLPLCEPKSSEPPEDDDGG